MDKHAEAVLTRREKRKLQLREEILEVALDLFAEKGFHAVTMQQVAERAEVAVGTLYNFFAGKEDLYQNLVYELARSVFVALRSLLSESGGNAYEIVRNYVASSWKMLSSDSRTLKLYLVETQGLRFSVRLQVDPELRQQHEGLTEDLAAVMDRGIREGFFRPLGGRELALMLQGISHTFFMDWIRDPVASAVDPNVERILDLFGRGVLRNEFRNG